MPQVPINYLAVVVAALSQMVVGSLWFGPLFGKLWMSLSGIKEADINAAKNRGMTMTYVVAFIGSLVMSYVLAHALVFASAYLDVYGVQAGLTAGFWNWLGFIAPVTLGIVLWDGKSWKLWFLTNAYWLLSLLIMGTILSLWQ